MPPPVLTDRLRSNQLLHCALILLLGIAVYAQTFQSPFVFDDFNMLSDGATSNLHTFLKAETWRNNRALGMLTFALNHRFNGTDVAGYHTVNLLVHLATSLTVYFLAIALQVSSRPQTRNEQDDFSRLFALCAALLFVAHPVNTQAVTYIVQRFASLATFWYLFSLCCYATFRNRRLMAASNGVALYGLSLASALFAMRCKETAFTLPFAVALYEWLFFKDSKSVRWSLVIPFLMLLPVIPLSINTPDKLLSGVMTQGTQATGIADAVPGRFEYFLTQSRVIMTYLRLLILPVNQNLDYDFPISTSLLSAPVLLSLSFLSLMLGAAIIRAVHPGGVPGTRVAAYGILLFFLGLSIESSIIPIKDVIFEHRLYLPSAGIFIAFTSALSTVSYSSVTCRRNTSALLLMLLLMAGACGVASHLRNRTWQSEVRLLHDIATKSPNKARPLLNLSAYYIRTGQPSSAMAYLKRIIQLDPKNAAAWYNMGMALGQQKQLDAAEKMYRKAIELQPGFQDAHAYLAWTLEQNGKTEQALASYREALRLNPKDSRSSMAILRIVNSGASSR